MTFSRDKLPPNLSPPHPNRNQVENPNLSSWLEDCAEASVVLAVAPAGFGKTTAILALHERLREAGVKTAWVQLNAEDNQLERFCDLVFAAIAATSEDGECNVEKSATNLFDAVYASTSCSFKLVDLVAGLKQSTALFLDDFDHITDPQILQTVQSMIERLHDHCRIIIAARAQPQLKLLKLRAQGKVLLIGLKELSFDVEQARTFFNARHHLDLDDASIKRLHQCTEGWPTGLQLAALALEKKQNKQDFIENFLTSATDIDHYLYEEVFLTQSSEVQAFLLKTSIVTQLNIPLANAIADTTKSASLLRGMDQQNLFLVRVGDGDTQYRFHPLFAEYLQKKLHAEDPSLEPVLHAKAAAWYRDSGDMATAIDYFLIAGDYAEACAMLSRHVWVAMYAGHLSACNRWLGAIPPAVLEHHADLLLAKCWVHIFQHDYVLARDLAYELRGRPELQDNGDYRILEPLTLGLMDQAEDCERVLASQLNNATITGPTAGVLHNIRAAVHLWAQRFDKVQRETDLAKATFRQYGGIYGLSFSLGFEANVLLIRGDVEQAVAVLESGFADIVQRSGQNSVCSAHLAIYLAEALHEQGDFQRSVKLATEYFDLTCATGITDTIVVCFRLLSRGYCRAGQYPRARGIVERGIELGRQLSLQRIAPAMRLEQQYQSIHQYDFAPDGPLKLIAFDDPVWAAIEPRMATGNDAENIDATRFRVWLRSGESQRVVAAAPSLIAEADRRDRVRLSIKLRILLAQALDVSGQTQRAVDELRAIFQMEKGQGLMSTFIEEGPGIISLLGKLKTSNCAPKVQERIQQILALGLSDAKESADGAAAAVAPPGSAPTVLTLKAIDSLSDRELQILNCLAAGMPNKSIAGKLFISEPTVKFHLRNINSKLRAKNRTHAVFIGRQLGLISG